MQYIEYKSLEKIAEITRGVSWKSGEESSEKSFENVRAYKIPHIIKNKKYVSEDEPLYIKKYKKHEAKLLTYNDILMITSNGNPNRVGNISLYKSREIAVPASFLLKIRGKEVVEQEFLYYFLSSDKAQSNITGSVAGSTGLRNINMAALKGLKVPVPPLKEQQKIAEILSTVDEQIEYTDQLIEKTKELKKGLMQQLLTKGIGHTEFKQSEFGEIPADWRIDQIGNVTEYVDYRGKTPQKTDEGVLLITAKNIKKGYIDYSVSKEYIDKDDYSNVMRRGKAYLGEVLFTTEAPLGNVAQVNNEKIALAQRVIKFNGNNSLNNTFLKYYLLSDIFQKKLISLATGSTVLGIQGKRLHKINILIPNLIEQQKIADILSSVDEDIEGYEEEKEKYEEMKKGLMQQLLTGKTRVKVD